MPERPRTNLPYHPRELLEEELEVRGMTASALATAMRVPEAAVDELLTGRRDIDAELALKLDSALGISALTWTELQGSFNDTNARIATDEPRAANQ